MDLISYSKKLARESLPEKFAFSLCKQLRQDNISAYYKKTGNDVYLAVGIVSFSRGIMPQEFFCLDINLNRNGKEIEVVWDKLLPSQKFSLHLCGVLQRAILNYISLRRGELLALLC